MFCNIINAISVTNDQFNMSLLKKQTNLVTPNFLRVVYKLS